MIQTNSAKSYPNAAKETEEALGENHSIAKIIRLVGDRKKVIDFGCSTGYLAHFLQRHNCAITGVEINPEDAKVAEEYCERVLVADLDLEPISLLFPEEKFDVAIFGDVLEHLKNPWKVLEEAQSILKPSGYVVASIPNIAHGAVRLALLRGEFQYSELGILDNTHLRFFTRKTVNDLFDQSGYLIDEIQTTKVGIFDSNSCIPQNESDQFEEDLIDKLLAKIQLDEDANTLQFVLKAFPASLERRHESLKGKYVELLGENERIEIANKQVVQEKEQLVKQLELAHEIQLEKEQDIQSKHNLKAIQQELEVAQQRLETLEGLSNDLQNQLKASQLQAEQSGNSLSQELRKCESLNREIAAQTINNQELRSQLDQACQSLLQSQHQLALADLDINGMKSSKFWRLRSKWFGVRNRLGLGNPDISFKQALLQKLRFALPLYSPPPLLPASTLSPPLLAAPAEIPVATDPLYQQWLNYNYPTSAILKRLVSCLPALKYQPLISVVVPTYNTPKAYLRQALDSVLNQVYPNWELCIADDHSTEPETRAVLQEYSAKDTRIKTVFRAENGHISLASNSALEIATGDFVALLDHDDLLTPDALYEVILLLNQHPEADMIYSDEDKIDDTGKLRDPFFKPDWCPDSFLSLMYTCHLGVYRRSIIEQIGGFRTGYEGGQDYDLVLRLTEITDRIFHIPKVLYHWRIHNGSSSSGDVMAKPYAYDSGQRAIYEALQRRGEPGSVTEGALPGHYIVRYDIQGYDKVSIIIPTRDLGDVLDQCLESIFTKSTYCNYEVILVDNGSTEPHAKKVIANWSEREPERFYCHPYTIPFNYSKLNNYGVSKAIGKYLLFLNNDTEVISPDWIEALIEQAQRPSIGAVGARLLYSDDTLQHGGVVVGLGGVAGHVHKGVGSTNHGYFGRLLDILNYSAVTAACLMCRRDAFEQVNGFNEELAVAFNDVDFCLRLLKAGFRNICLPHAELYHHESKSRGYEDTPEKQRRFQTEINYMRDQWKTASMKDPCYNPNLSLDCEGCKITKNPQSLA